MGAAPESNHGGLREAAAGRVVVVIPTLDEEQSIADVVRGIPRAIVSRVIVADGGSRDATAARAKAAGADVIDAGRGYGRACLKATMVAEDADIVVFMDGDGADDPRSIAALVEPIRSGGCDFVIGSRARQARTGKHRLASARGRAPGRLGHAASLRRGLHGYVRAAGDPASGATRARNARAHLWMESRNADARRPSRAAHPGDSG